MADFKKFKEKHETVIQFIKFSLISMLAGLTETISFLIMSYLLPARLPTKFDFFVFHYDTTGMFVAFFVSAILAEIVSFTINRKATFNANNNVVKSAVMYFSMVLVVICLKTWIAGALQPVMRGVTDIKLLIDWVPKLVSMLVAVAIIFPMNKFVIMKHTDEPEKEKAEEK